MKDRDEVIDPGPVPQWDEPTPSPLERMDDLAQRARVAQDKVGWAGFSDPAELAGATMAVARVVTSLVGSVRSLVERVIEIDTRMAPAPVTVPVEWDVFARSPRELAIDTLHSETDLQLDECEQAIDTLLAAPAVLDTLAGRRMSGALAHAEDQIHRLRDQANAMADDLLKAAEQRYGDALVTGEQAAELPPGSAIVVVWPDGEESTSALIRVATDHAGEVYGADVDNHLISGPHPLLSYARYRVLWTPKGESST